MKDTLVSKNFWKENDYMNYIKKILSFLFIFIFISSFSLADVVQLPMDEDVPGFVPSTESRDDKDKYSDESIDVSVVRHSVGALHCFAVYVKIKDPSQLRTGMSGDYDTSRAIPAKALNKKYMPVVSASGDFFKGNDYGYLVRQSKLYRERPDAKRDVLLIDNNADFHVLKEPTLDDINNYISSLPEGTIIVNSFNFGPILIKDGAVQDVTSHLYSANYQHMRVAIAQLDKLEYAIFLCEGKATGTFGMTMQRFANWILSVEPRVKIAYNLDGGGSAHVYVADTKLLQNPNPRYIYDIVYFASASDKNERVK